MTELTLHHAPLSRSSRTLWLLEEIGCDYELVTLAMPKTLDAALHPSPPPSLCDGTAQMHETGAMTEWLCETRAPQLWRAPGTTARIGWLDWLHFAETLVQHVARRSETGASGRLADALGLLEDWLAGSDWLLSEFSGADCQVGYSLWVAAQVTPLGPYPALAAYLDRCVTRPAARTALGGAELRLG
ncbi:glutathione S-transferase family protein [Mesobaculum littorinae]|uniref:Glutathione S-transferase family protein n=1 Tax=Mesobaculum littorinae TaxID=2486419 RepID=A0A438AFP1_9RHOB|nr:glutathione S-transferase family protein [Mesobaculum littorinae]RVV97521.1 glutathione S-transferase family protein [Mesobaculum littorinae]